MTYARIIGTGHYLPDKIISNNDLAQKLDTSDEWIVTRTGIKQRHVVTDETTCDMGYYAALNALKAADKKANEIDLIIFATSTPDKIFPATASFLAAKLQVNCPVFDIQAVCAGFIYALATANQYIRSGEMKNILVVAAESFSKILDWQDRSTAVLFGDGGGAMVLSADEQTGIVHSKLAGDSRYLSSLYVDNDGIDHHGFIRMTGQDVFKVAVNELSELAQQTLKKCKVSANDLNWMVPHQANIRIMQAIAKKINLPMDKVVVTVDKHGNTSAASIPLAFDVAVKDGRIKKGDLCLLEGIGAGFVWGSILLTF